MKFSHDIIISNDYNSLKKLSIDNCNVKIIPDFRKLTLLVEVDLSSNLIKDIPDYLLECDSIVKLDLRYNEFESIPKKIFTMKRLCYLPCMNIESYYKYNDIVYLKHKHYDNENIIDSTINKLIIENCRGFENY